MNKGKVKETNKGKILEILFDSPKTTAELARELGYINPEGTARYNMITKDLKELVRKKYLKSERVKKEQRSGNTPTLYSINFSIQSLRNMIDEYPCLISKMKKENLVLEAIFDEHSSLIKRLDNEIYYHRKIELNKSSFKNPKDTLKKKMQLSSEFFKFILINDTNKLANYTETIAKVFDEDTSKKFYKLYNLDDKVAEIHDIAIKRGIYFGLDAAFKACVIKGIMDGHSNTSAIEYIKQMRNEISDEQTEQEEKIESSRIYPESTELPPILLEQKELTSIENSKTR